MPPLRSPTFEFWQNKFDANVRRDKDEQEQLKSMGWRILIVWECELKKEKRDITLEHLYESIVS